MGDSDDEYDRKRRDKFRGERSAGDNYRSERRGEERRREDWGDRGRPRADYRGEYRGPRERYSPGRDLPPPKRMRPDWGDDGRTRYGGHDAYGGMYGWPHDPYPMHGGHAFVAPPPIGGHQRESINPADMQTQPPMLTLKQFLDTQDDGISDSEVLRKYSEYKLDFKRQQLNEFFVAHKDEEWFKNKYHPEESLKRKDEQHGFLKNRVNVFSELLEKGDITAVSVDTNQADPLLRLLDTVVIKLEGGTEEDLKILDEKPSYDFKPTESKFSDIKRNLDDDVVITEFKKNKSPKQESASWDAIQIKKSEPKYSSGGGDDEDWDDGGGEQNKSASKKDGDEWDDSMEDKPKNDDGDWESSKEKKAVEEKDKSPKTNKDDEDEESKTKKDENADSDTEKAAKKAKKEKRERSDSESSDSSTGSGQKDEKGKDADEGDDRDNVPDEKKNGKVDGVKDDEEKEDKKHGEEEKVKSEDEKGKTKGKDLSDQDVEMKDKNEKTEKDTEIKDEKKDDVDKSEEKEEKPETIDLDKEKDPETAEENGPRALHRTSSIFLRNLAPTITKAEIEAVCKRYSGFLRVAIADPLAERRWFRRGWVTFKRDVNIKEICWNLNNIRLRDCELGAIVNRDLSRRVRPVNGLTAHKTIVRSDIKLCANIAHNLDEKFGLWLLNEAQTESDGKDSANNKGHFGFKTKNPVLQNITDYLIEEASAEEDELLGLSGSENKDGIEGEMLERDPQLISVLDKLILYLRIVHSVDFYNHCEYPYEDEMPNRCGIIHARGPPPQNKVTNNDIQDYIKNFETKMTSFLSKTTNIEDDELKNLGSKDPEAEVEKFIQANTQELAKDKWLCPLSGKKFKGPEFIRKHIFNKHGEKVDEVRKEVEYFNNYLKDPKRPQLPEHPGNTKRQSTDGGAQPGYRQGGYGGPMYPAPYAAYAPPMVAPPRPRGFGNRRDLPMEHQRRVIGYHDLDAPFNFDGFD